MKKIFYFGKIGFNNTGTKNNEVDIEMEYKEDRGKKTLTISAKVWNSRHSDIVCGGQCLDTLEPYFKDNPLFNEIYRLWDLYHLNDMHPECEHQRALGWLDIAKKQVSIYYWYLNKEARALKKIAEDKALNALRNGETFTPSENDVLYASLELFCTTCTPEAPQYYDIATDFSTKKQKVEIKSLGFTYPSECPDGILCKPCPVCGYKYGTQWDYVPVPKEDEKIIYDLLKEESEEK